MVSQVARFKVPTRDGPLLKGHTTLAKFSGTHTRAYLQTHGDKLAKFLAEIGAGVTGWAPGDRAMALLSGGGYAERAVVPAGQLMPVPAGMDLVTAAAVPE